MVETRVVNDRTMLPEVGEQNDNGENEKRGKKRRIKRSRRGRRVTERKRGHAGPIAALCDLSENSRQSAIRPLAVTHAGQSCS